MSVLVSSWSQPVVVSRSFGASLRDGIDTPRIEKKSGGLPTKCGGSGRTCLLLVRWPYTVTMQSRRGIELSVVGFCATGHTRVLQKTFGTLLHVLLNYHSLIIINIFL